MDIKVGRTPDKSNYRRGRTSYIQYIVIHYTANKGDTALNNVMYFANNSGISASAHYFVDNKFIYSSVPVGDTAWHCGGGKQSSTGGAYYKKCTNDNSIGIEMCLWDKYGEIQNGAIDNTIELTRHLMNKYNIPADRVIRHWDVTGKSCPKPFVGDNNSYWNNFKSRLIDSEEIDMEELKALQKTVDQLASKINKLLEDKMIYNYIDDNMPEFARGTVKKLCDKGYLKGDEGGLNLNYDMLRILVILDRSGAFDN